MAQSAAAYSYKTAETLRDQLIEAYLTHSSRTDELTRQRAEETFVIVNRTRWMPPNTVVGSHAYNHADPEDFRPSEWSELHVHERGESGLTPVTLRAIAAVGFGVEQPYDNFEHGARVYHLSSYGRSDAPSWDFSNPDQSGIDETRPADVREENVVAYLDGKSYEVPGHEGTHTRATDEAELTC